MTPKPKKRSFGCESQKYALEIGQICKTENPNAPRFTDRLKVGAHDATLHTTLATACATSKLHYVSTVPRIVPAKSHGTFLLCATAVPCMLHAMFCMMLHHMSQPSKTLIIIAP